MKNIRSNEYNIYINFELEKELMDEKKRNFLLMLEDDLIFFLENKGKYYIKECRYFLY